ncbi:MAG: malto-oligosyltrehalose synthase [Terracidiphilus sp.]
MDFATSRRIVSPSSTYRLQLHHSFTFDDAAGIADYLKALGISHVYCSPYLQAAPGSMHGYDVVDPEKVNEELGGEEGFARFRQRLKELKLGQILDIVPNHMALGPNNRYWWDVLENGPSSRYADWFDIDWHSSEVKLQNKILIPVLADQYGRILSAGEIKLERENNRFQLRYLDHLFPLAPRSLTKVLRKAADGSHDDMLNFIADSFSRLAASESTDRAVAFARHRDKTVSYELLNRRCDENPDVCESISATLRKLNNNIDELDDIVNQQNYRLAYWRTADQELGYRRFFDVNTLVGLRAEREHVFLATHCRILEWLRAGVLDGVRVDHPDGLRDPKQYFERLRSYAPKAWIVAEKILEPGEQIRESWPIQGTTGYDFLNVCNSLMMQPDGLKNLTELYSRFAGEPVDFQSVAREKKLNVEHEALGSDVNRLANLFVGICENNRDRRDYTRAEIRRVIREVAACCRVYRTYADPMRNEIADEDIAQVDAAVSLAKGRRQDIDAGLFDFIGDVLTLRARGELESEFLLRFQQFTSPVMAKGVEDTAFYCFNRLIGLNEVGGDPGRNGVGLAEFHEYCARTQMLKPGTMSTLSTHDAKRADDVRARLAVITEAPDRWRAAVARWSRRNRLFRAGQYPDRNTEYFLYQTLVGAWPISKERLIAYMEKATREAKQHTSWSQQNKEYEDSVRSFIEQILESPDFLAELEDFVQYVLEAGRVNSLAQTLIKLTAPGVPDTYQGSELWDLSLVDPDNRRPVDYEERFRLLEELRAGMGVGEILRRIDSGLPKLWVIHCALHLRLKHPEWFGEDASYVPIIADGPRSEHLVGFSRGESVIILVPRWSLKLGGRWSSTSVSLPSGRWKNRLTGEVATGGRVPVQKLFHQFPVALLVREVE